MLANHLPPREQIYLLLILEINKELKYQTAQLWEQNTIMQKGGVWPEHLTSFTQLQCLDMENIPQFARIGCVIHTGTAA